MTLDYNALKNWNFEKVVQKYSWREVSLYALSVGYAENVTDPRELKFIYENGMTPPPTLPVILGSPGFWLDNPKTGVNWVKVLHGEHSLTLHRPIPSAAEIFSEMRITHIIDKGVGKGAILVQERKIYDAKTNVALATIEHLTFCRGDGGFSTIEGNGPPGGDKYTSKSTSTPTRPADKTCELSTISQAALFYRLCGDLNPLHVDPAVAKQGGFDRPILHGLATFSIAGHAILKTFCKYDTERLKSIRMRFKSPFYPGETLKTEFWGNKKGIQFRSFAMERNKEVLSNGFAEIT